MACSGKPLAAKLGLKAGERIIAVDAPPDYKRILGRLPTGARILRRPTSAAKLVHFFALSRRNLEERLPALAASLVQDGALWVSWPKKSSGVLTDLDENRVRAIGLEEGLVDAKVCAVDAIWSGLKFVYRLKNRTPGRH